MPERDAPRIRGQHPRGEALVKVLECVAGHTLEEPELRPLRDDGDRLEERLRRSAEWRGMREHGVANRVGDLGSAGGERFDDEERVARRLRVHVVRVGFEGLRELGYSFPGERR